MPPGFSWWHVYWCVRWDQVQMIEEVRDGLELWVNPLRDCYVAAVFKRALSKVLGINCCSRR
jgi:hypothetical protein